MAVGAVSWNAPAPMCDIDFSYTWSNIPGHGEDTNFGRRLGYKVKSFVDPAYVAVINRLLTPSPKEVIHAEPITLAFRVAQPPGEVRG